MVKDRRYLVQVCIGLGLTLSSSVWVNLLTSSLVNKNYLQAIIGLGWTNLCLAVDLILIVSQWLVIRFWRLGDQKIAGALSEKYKSLETEMISATLKLSVEGIRALKSNAKINASYYYPSVMKNDKVLIKHKKVQVETVPMPDGYGLDYAVVDKDDLVICQSFKCKRMLYSVLSANHVINYNERIANKIDPKQKWVLCCPVFNTDLLEDPKAMIVFYGGAIIAKNENEVTSLKQVAVSAAGNISEILKVGDVIARESVKM